MIGIHYLKNGIEIVFFSTLVYVFSVWLKNDKRCNLLLYFYAYYLTFSGAFFLNLTTISLFLLYSSPIVLFLFIIFHQEILQKNFVTLTHPQTILSSHSELWLENLIRICLHHMNKNSYLYVVIENFSDLAPFIKSNYIVNSALSLELLSLVTESAHFDCNKIIWCNNTGTLIGINSSWQISAPNQATSAIPTWQQEALLMTLKTDTIVFKVNPHNRCFEIILKGTLYESVNAHQIIPFIKKNLHLRNQNLQKGEFNHDNQNIAKKQSTQQPNS